MSRRVLQDPERRLHSPDADTPAIIREDGYEAYYAHGELHRTTGPAVVRPDRTVEFWIGGHNLTSEEFETLIRAGVDLDDPLVVLEATAGV